MIEFRASRSYEIFSQDISYMLLLEILRPHRFRIIQTEGTST